jgi:hypothetical protein
VKSVGSCTDKAQRPNGLRLNGAEGVRCSRGLGAWCVRAIAIDSVTEEEQQDRCGEEKIKRCHAESQNPCCCCCEPGGQIRSLSVGSEESPCHHDAKYSECDFKKADDRHRESTRGVPDNVRNASEVVKQVPDKVRPSQRDVPPTCWNSECADRGHGSFCPTRLTACGSAARAAKPPESAAAAG